MDNLGNVDQGEEGKGEPLGKTLGGPAGLVWSREKPKADGFYWYRVPGQTKQSIDLVLMFTGSPCWHSAERHAWLPIARNLEWAGPIPEPTTAEALKARSARPSSGGPTPGSSPTSPQGVEARPMKGAPCEACGANRNEAKLAAFREDLAAQEKEKGARPSTLEAAAMLAKAIAAAPLSGEGDKP